MASSHSIFAIPEILDLVFLSLPHIDVVGTVGQVCRSWKTVVDNPSPALEYYKSTGVRPNQHLPYNNLKVTPASLALLALFWTKTERIVHSTIESLPELQIPEPSFWSRCFEREKSRRQRAEYQFIGSTLRESLQKLFASFLPVLQDIHLFFPASPPYCRRKRPIDTTTFYDYYPGTKLDFHTEFTGFFLDQYPSLKRPDGNVVVKIAHKLCELAFYEALGLAARRSSFGHIVNLAVVDGEWGLDSHAGDSSCGLNGCLAAGKPSKENTNLHTQIQLCFGPTDCVRNGDNELTAQLFRDANDVRIARIKARYERRGRLWLIEPVETFHFSGEEIVLPKYKIDEDILGNARRRNRTSRFFHPASQ
ncbi:hypothetical protein Dda_0066 [Drechslerella dactyloides]|uniref:F-box domain-containing protein n=1 Tax=Drechslerella dactyloides TaxID=74499 RepID=A0AAD6J5I9_DREDA|nr:hypothetical protein Dda_0066 [Drechslerella dactyloides]